MNVHDVFSYSQLYGLVDNEFEVSEHCNKIVPLDDMLQFAAI